MSSSLIAKRALLFAGVFAASVALGFVVSRPFQKTVVQSVSLHLAQRGVTSAFHKHRLNFVVLGAQPDEGTSDTIILVHLDLDRQLATFVSIPRDTWVPIPGHGDQKLNAALAFGGPKLTAQLVGDLTGAHIDSTLVIDPGGAKQLVDAIGGLNIVVEHDMDYDDNYGNLHIHLKKGEQFLNGGQVLEYMRFRSDIESDWGRMRRQQEVLHEIVRELGQPQNWAKVPRLLALARHDVQTPLTDAQLQALIELYHSVPPENVRAFTLPGRATFVRDASVVIVDDWWARIVGQLVCSQDDPPQEVVLVANATGIPSVGATLVSALRGGGWNVQTSVDAPTKEVTRVVGRDRAAHRLAEIFSGVPHTPGPSTVLDVGTSADPRI